jgi:spore maturation protein CgeB
MSTRFLIYGESWTGTLPRLLTDELRERGLPVQLFDFTDYMPGIRDRSLGQRVRRRLFPSRYQRRVQAEFLRTVAEFGPHVIIVSKGLHLARATLDGLSARGIYIVNWNPDDFFNMKNSSAGLLAAMPAYDLIVSSREHLFARYREHGARALLSLSWYYVPSLHFDHQLPVVREASFVGSWSPTREAFIGGLRKRFGVWGGGWEKSSMGFRRDHDVAGKVLNQVEMSQVFGTSRYNLNLLTHENNDRSNLRVFEVTASRGLLLTERNDEVASLLTDRQDCLMFSSREEVNELFAHTLDLERIARSGFDRIRDAGNTFTDRVDTLLAYVGSQL